MFGKKRDKVVKIVGYVLGAVIIASMVFSYAAFTL